MNNFKKLAKESDAKGIEILNTILSNFSYEYEIIKAVDEFSSFDLALHIKSIGTFLIEIKFRKSQYPNYLMEEKKYVKLLEFSKRDDIIDVLYLNVFSDNTFRMFSINQISTIKPIIIDKILNLSQTSLYIYDILKTTTMQPEKTAYTSKRVPKASYFLPNMLAVDVDSIASLYTLTTKPKGLF
jgi:hypothetical protein